MKKILEKTIPFMIGSFICMPINYLYQFSWIQAFLISLTISIAYFIAIVLVEKVYPILKTLKNPFKRLWFWLRYKRVQEIKMKSCYGCVLELENGSCKIKNGDYCWLNNSIYIKRSYNPFKWIKKLFAFIIIAITISSCVTINVYKYEPQKTTSADTNKTESYWF